MITVDKSIKNKILTSALAAAVAFTAVPAAGVVSCGTIGTVAAKAAITAEAGEQDTAQSGVTTEEKTVSVLAKPAVTSFSVKKKLGSGVASITVRNGSFRYGSDGEAQTSADTFVELYQNDKKIASITIEGDSQKVTVPVKSLTYGKSDTFIAKSFMRIDGTKYEGTSKTIHAKSLKIAAPAGLKATKISSNKAVISWKEVDGADGYRIYQGAKLVKTVAGDVTSWTNSTKGAGTAAYTVAATFVQNKKTYTGKKSIAIKPAANQKTLGSKPEIKNYSYKTCNFVATKVSLSKKTYKVTGYAVNNRTHKMKRYKKLKVTVYSNGKIVAKKTFKNVKVNVKANKTKKLTLKLKGTAGIDLADSTVEIKASEKCVWLQKNGMLLNT